MKRAKKGFTLVEAIVTIAVLGVTGTLTVLAVNQLTSIQNGAANQVGDETTLNRADELTNEFISYVSIASPASSGGLSFSIDPSIGQDAKEITFFASYDNKSFPYILEFDSSAKTLTVSLPDNPPSGYLSKQNWTKVSNLTNVKFNYESSIHLLTADFYISETAFRRYAYVLRIDA